MSSIIIRPPFENEAESINSLIREVFLECVAPDYSKEGVDFFLNLCKSEEVRKKINETGQIIVALENKKIVGMLWTRDINHISRFFVHVEYQRKGIGKQLFSYLLEKLQKNHPEIKDITVYSSPFACKAYEMLGFRKTDQEQIGNGMRYTPMTYRIV
jgi:GNAT superfamily N-acetyltransferase